MSGHFENGVWVEEPSGVIHYQCSYPDVPTQLGILMREMGRMALQMEKIQDQLQDLRQEMRWMK